MSSLSPYLLSAVLLAGCTDPNDPFPCIPVDDGRVDVGAGAIAQTYLLDSLNLPGSAQEASELAFDLDLDDQGRPDNALGQVLSVLVAVDAGDVEGAANQAIEQGQLLHLLTIVSTDFDSSDAAMVRLQHGVDRDGDPSDNFSGVEVFGIDSTRGHGRLEGSIESGRLLASGAQLPIALAVPGSSAIYPLRLDIARIDAVVTDTGLEGRIGGAIPEDQVLSVFVDFLSEAIEVALARDCVGRDCTQDSFGALVIDIFDTNPPDGQISTQELEQSNLLQLLLTPDMDSRNRVDGDLALRCDGEKDALSIGFEFTAVPAEIE